MNILISSNDKYIFPAVVLLTSICLNNREEIMVYLLYNHLSAESMSKIRKLTGQYRNTKIEFIGIPDGLFDGVPLGGRTNPYISEETYFRLAAGEILPSSVKRILYLDTDMVVNGDMTSFYHYNFQEKSIALVCEDYGLNIANQLKKEVYRNLRLPERHRYFNAGVMLIDLERLRENYTLSDFMDFIRANDKQLIFHDQDVMNKMFLSKVEYADYERYNCRPFFYPYSKKNNKRVEESIVIHYGEKPWDISFCDMAGEVFWKYAKNAGFEKEEMEFREKNEIYQKNHWVNIRVKRIKRNLKLFYLRNVRGIK